MPGAWAILGARCARQRPRHPQGLGALSSVGDIHSLWALVVRLARHEDDEKDEAA